MKGRMWLAPATLALLSACNPQPQQPTAPAGQGGTVAPVMPATEHRGQTATKGKGTINPLSPPSDLRSAKGARDLVGYYYRLVQAGDLNRAQSLWHGTIGSEDNADFVARFSGDIIEKLAIGAPYDEEGAAGTLYISVPVSFSGHVKPYPEQRFVEKRIVTLRRVNDVDGSTDAQRKWHIASIRDPATPEGTPSVAY